MKTERKSLFTCNDLPDKEKRNLAIFELIRKKGHISKPEISRITGINIVSVSNYIENYVAKRLISEKESAVSSGGRKPDLVELNKKDLFVIGVDLADAAIRVAACDLGGNPVAKVGPFEAKAPDASAIGDALEQVMKKAALTAGSVSAIGLGVGDGSLLAAGEALGKRFGIDVFVGGAAQCAAFGERLYEDVTDADDILYMHSDLGCGVVIKEHACYGALDCNGVEGAAGGYGDEIAYLRPWDARLGVVAAARAEVARGIGTKIVDMASGRLEKITVAAVIEAARKDDKVAVAILRSAGINLGVRTAYLINVFNPSTVIIGGGIEEAGDCVLLPLQNMVKRFAFAKKAARVKIIAGSLGADAVSLGAASLAIREVFLRA